MSQPHWHNVEIKLCQRCFNVVSASSNNNIVSSFCKAENPTLNCVFFTTSNQRLFNVDPTLKCCLGNKQPMLITYFMLNSENIVIVLHSQQILIPRISQGHPYRTSLRRSLKMLSSYPDVLGMSQPDALETSQNDVKETS